jgi:hypothetical protein
MRFALVLVLFLSWLAASPAARAEEAPEPEPPADLAILYDGSTGGLAGASCSLGAHWDALFEQPPPGVELSLRATALGMLHDAGRFVVSPSRPSDLLAAADAVEGRGRRVEIVAERVPALVTEMGVTFQWPLEGSPDLVSRVEQAMRAGRKTAKQWMLDVRRHEARLLRAVSGAHEALVLELPPEAVADAAGRGELPARADAFETTVGLVARAGFGDHESTVYTLCRMQGTASRRVPLLRAAVAAVGRDRTLLFGAGNNLPQPAPGLLATAETVEASLALAEELGYDAMVPGDWELERGIGWLLDKARRHRLPYVAANLVWRTGRLAKKPIFRPYRIFTRGGRSVGVIGVVPEELRRAVYGKRLGNATVLDGMQAVDEAMTAMITELGRRPDLTVLLTTLRGSGALALGYQPDGVDLVLGAFPWRFAGLGLEQSAFAPEGRRPFARRPLMVVQGVPRAPGRIDVRFGVDADGAYPLALRHRVIPVPPGAMPDHALRRAFTAAVVRAAREASDEVLPGADVVVGEDAELAARAREGRRDPGPIVWAPPLVHTLAAHLAREALGAEIGVVREFKLDVHSGGAMSASLVATMPRETARLVAIDLSGRELGELALVGKGEHALVFAGFEPDKRLVDGRPLDEKERYRVAVPDVLLTDPVFEALFKEKRAERGPALADVLVAELRRLRDASGGDREAHLAALRARLRPRGEGPRPLWIIGFEQIGLTYTVNKASETEQFARVREQRLKAPSYQLLTARGTLSVTLDSAPVVGRNAGSFKFNRIYFGELDAEIPQGQRELEDLVVAETETRLRVMRIGVGNELYDLIPFLKPGLLLSTGCRDARRQGLSHTAAPTNGAPQGAAAGQLMFETITR